jgi:hypothetical protein
MAQQNKHKKTHNARRSPIKDSPFYYGEKGEGGVEITTLPLEHLLHFFGGYILIFRWVEE